MGNAQVLQVYSMNKIDVKTAIKLVVRSLFIDSAWNFQKHQNIGFIYVILNFLKGLYVKRELIIPAMKRHTHYMSTNPFMVTAIVGVALKAEKEMAFGRSTGDMQKLKTTMMGPLGAIGDSFFWAALKPFMMLVAVVFITIFEPYYKFQIIGLVFCWLVYNTIKTWIMYYGIQTGYSKGIEFLKEFKSLGLQNIVSPLRYYSTIILGSFLAIIWPIRFFNIANLPVPTNLFALGVTFLFAIGIKIKISSMALFFTTIAFCIILNYLVPVSSIVAIRE